uniref:Dynein heavy chain 7, axonemal-like n=1 Tax=Diabrotica virgifera virgifera TaxID=50390 RepID=A0A6P7FY36_DIAVI
MANRIMPQVIYSIGDEYQTISDKALAIPDDTHELIATIRYVADVQAITMLDLEDKLRDVMNYILLLTDYVIFTPVEMKLNNNAFQW